MSLALLCSGQGRQGRRMFELVRDEPAAQPVFAACTPLLGCDPRDFVHDASRLQGLHDNRTGQLLCVTRALATAACLQGALPSPVLLAGYSVGEMAAWGIAGVWKPETTLCLTARRAELMDAASTTDDGLGSIRGLSRIEVEALAQRFACAIAIVNPGNLFIIGGQRQDVTACCEAALHRGAARAGPIDVHVASHTPRLQSAVIPFLKVLQSEPASRPALAYALMSASAAVMVREPGKAMAKLAAQLGSTIEWATTLDSLGERGATQFLELGPGTALADMVRGTDPALEARSADDFRSIDGLRQWMSGRGS